MEVLLTLAIKEQEGNNCIEVADTGLGMSSSQIEAFNTSSHQLGATTLGTANEKGTGLGLVLCKSFAEMMGVNLKLKANMLKGAVFTLCLPKL